MRRMLRKAMRKVRRHHNNHKKPLSILQIIRMYAGMPVGV